MTVLSTAYINGIISHVTCCLGTLGDTIYNKSTIGSKCKETEYKLKLAYLFRYALAGYSQDDDFEIAEYSDITVQERDYVIEGIKKICGCVSIDETGSSSSTTQENNYWVNGYTDNDSGPTSYNG